MSNHEKKKKNPPKNHLPRPIDPRAGRVDRSNGKRSRDLKKLDNEARDLIRPASGKNSVVFYPKVRKDNISLAKEFYWCDERSFYEMKVPFEEAKQFALASYTFQDADPEIYNFLPRVRKAQKEALQYCVWLIRAANLGL